MRARWKVALWILIPLAALLAGGLWYARANLGPLAASILKEQASKNLNGRLEFQKIKIDALGRAVITDVAIYETGIKAPVITCPRIIASVDLLNILGVNRGKRAIALTLDAPKLELVREPDGGFSLDNLVKPRSERPAEWAMSLHINSGEVDFTDACMLQGLELEIPSQEGIAKQLLEEAAFGKRSEVRLFQSLLTLDGDVSYNPESQEMSVRLKTALDQDGVLDASGRLLADGSDFDLNLGAKGVSLATLKPYINTLMPRLRLPGDWTPGQELPQIAGIAAAGTIEGAEFSLEKSKGQDVSAGGWLLLTDAWLASQALPDLRVKSARAEYYPAKEKLELALEASVEEVSLDGQVALGGKERKLTGSLHFSAKDIGDLARLAQADSPPLQGSLNADLRLSGTAKEPLLDISASAGSMVLKGQGGKVALGNATVKASLHGSALQVTQAKLGGGEISASANGELDMEDGAGSIEIKAGPAKASALIGLARSLSGEKPNAKLPLESAEGSLRFDAKLSLSHLRGQDTIGQRLSTTFSVNCPKLSITLQGGREVLLGKANLAGNITPARMDLNKVSFTGGDIPLTGSGSYTYATKDGKFTLTAGPSDIGAMIETVQRLAPREGKQQDLPEELQKARGDVSVSAILAINSGRPSGSLGLSAESLDIAGNKISKLKASGQAKGTSIEIESIECAWQPPYKADMAGLTSDGNLSFAVRAGGSVSLPPQGKGGAAIILNGKALTQNLQPHQATVSFKLTGPVDGPTLKVQAKTDAKQPLGVSAELPLGSKDAPISASATWMGMSAAFKGSANLKQQTIDGKLTAEKVDLASLGKGNALSGKLDASAQISGAIKTPSISGRVASDRLSLDAGGKQYAVTKLLGGFKLAPGADGDWVLAISKAGFVFDNNSFGIDGVLGKDSKQIVLECEDFNLLSALAIVPPPKPTDKQAGPNKPPVQVKSSGPLKATITGDLSDPQLAVTYASKAGNIAGQAFEGASLKANGNLRSFNVEQFTISGIQGSLKASGSVAFTHADTHANSDSHSPAVAATRKPYKAASLLARLGISSARAQGDSTEAQINLQGGKASGKGPASSAGRPSLPTGVGSWNAKLELDNFDASAAAPLARVEALSSLKGKVQGKATLSGSSSALSGDGSLSITKGSFNGVEFSSADVAFKTKGKGVEISSATVKSGSSLLSAYGSIGADPKDLRLSAKADQLDLALLAPLMPKGSPAIAGSVNANLDITPGKGAYPDVSVTLSDSGHGITAGAAKFNSVSADAAMRSDQLTVKRLTLTSGQSSLDAGGKLAAELLLGSGESSPGRRAPLDFWVKAERFRTADIKPLLPKETASAPALPDGVVSCDVKVGGNLGDPKLSGPLTFQLAELPGGEALGLTGASGEIQFTQNNFDIRRLTLDAEGDSKAVITGSGGLTLNPVALRPGSSIDINLSPEGRYFHPQAAALPFDGTVGGRLIVQGSRDPNSEQPWVIGGSLIITEPKSSSLFSYKPMKPGEQGEASRARIENLTLKINSGTEFAYRPEGAAAKLSDLRAKVEGQLTVNGVPGKMSGKDRLRLEGELSLTDGSMRVHRHIVRLDGLENKLVWPKSSSTSDSGGLIPRLTARGALTLDHVLAGADITVSTGTPGGTLPGGMGASTDDLTVYFNFSDVPLDDPKTITDSMKLSSAPPLPEDKILLYLLGGADKVLTGESDLGEFAEGELLAFGTTFISRAVERSLGLNRFSLGGTGATDNPYYVNMEKDLNDDVSFSYFRNFYSQTGQQEEYGLRYKLLESQTGGKYRNLQLQMNFDPSSATGRGAEFMFTWTTKF